MTACVVLIIIPLIMFHFICYTAHCQLLPLFWLTMELTCNPRRSKIMCLRGVI